MELMHHLQDNLHNLIYFVEREMTGDVDDQSNEDNFGVGAVMPQDMPEHMFLTETESYGI
ncbi:MAG: hypothetical protein ABL880_11550 [Methylotenera sp.]